MHLNKISEEPSPRYPQSNTPIYKPTTLQFSYLKRKPRSHKNPIAFSSLDSYQVQLSDTSRHTLNLQQLRTEPADPASYSIPTKQKPMNKHLLIMRSETPSEMEYISCGFPQRKKKSNEYQLFKMLSKYSQYKHTHRFYTEPSHSLQKQLYPIDRPTHTGIKPHLKSKPKIKWDKNRYCANRDRDGGILPLSLIPRFENPTERIKFIQVNNPLTHL